MPLPANWTTADTAAEHVDAHNDAEGVINTLETDLAAEEAARIAADAAKIDKATLDANSVLYATADDTPAALAMAASTILARLAAGNVVAATPAQIKTLLSIATGDVSGLGNSATRAVGTGSGDVAAGNVLATQPETIGVALSDETTAITTGNAKVTIRMPFAFTLSSVRASLTTASSSGTPTVDINEGGTTILSTKLTVDASEKTSTTAAVPAVISDAALADDAEITFDVDVAGTGAAGLKVWLVGTRT